MKKWRDVARRLVVGLIVVFCMVESARALDCVSPLACADGSIELGDEVAASLGGTGVNNTATADRYLKGNGTGFATSSTAAAGAGGCTNQFPRTLNSDATPTCASVNLETDTTGTTPINKGGTGSTSFTTDRCVRFNGTAIVTASGDCTAGDTNTLGVEKFGTNMDITQGQTVYLNTGLIDPTEVNAEVPMPAGTWKNLRCYQTAAAGVSNDVVITSGVGTCGGSMTYSSLSVTITGGASAASGSDTSNTLTVSSAGQCVVFKLVAPASLSNNQRIQCSYERLT